MLRRAFHSRQMSYLMPYHSALICSYKNLLLQLHNMVSNKSATSAKYSASIQSNPMHSSVIGRSPSTVGPALVVSSLFVLVVPFLSLLHFTDVPIISSSNDNIQITSSMMSKSMLPSLPQIVASCLVMYMSVCLHYVGMKLITSG